MRHETIESNSYLSEDAVERLLEKYRDKGLRESGTAFVIKVKSPERIVHIHKFKAIPQEVTNENIEELRKKYPNFTLKEGTDFGIPMEEYLEAAFAKIEERGEEVEIE